MNSARISYTPRPDTNARAELDVLASVYAYLLKSHNSKKGSRPAAPDDDAKEFHGCIAYPNHNR